MVVYQPTNQPAAKHIKLKGRVQWNGKSPFHIGLFSDFMGRDMSDPIILFVGIVIIVSELGQGENLILQFPMAFEIIF